MAGKPVKTVIRLHIEAGQATPAPPVGPALATQGVNLGEFTQKFNEATREQSGFKIPVDIIVYEDRTFEMKLHQPPASQLLKKAAGIEKGSGTPNKKGSGTIQKEQLRQIAEQKASDLNASSTEQAMKIIEGTAKNMGIKIS